MEGWKCMNEIKSILIVSLNFFIIYVTSCTISPFLFQMKCICFFNRYLYYTYVTYKLLDCKRLERFKVKIKIDKYTNVHTYIYVSWMCT